MTKNSRQKLKYLDNKKSFSGEVKSILHHFSRASSCQKMSQTCECAFKVRQDSYLTICVFLISTNTLSLFFVKLVMHNLSGITVRYSLKSLESIPSWFFSVCPKLLLTWRKAYLTQLYMINAAGSNCPVISYYLDSPRT